MSLTDSSPVFFSQRPPCTGFAGANAYSNCWSQGYLDTGGFASDTSAFISPNTFTGNAPPVDEDFQQAFNLWAASNSNWTLSEGANLDLDLNVTRFRAGTPYVNAGGLQTAGPAAGINVDVANYTPGGGDPTIAQLVWVQALYINYQPPSTTGIAPVLTLDNFSFNNLTGTCTAIPSGSGTLTFPDNSAGTGYCDPVYPYQYGDGHFYDAPLGSYVPASSFRGVALLASVDEQDNEYTLTVYQGVSYGFDTGVAPEPSLSLWQASPSRASCGSIERPAMPNLPRETVPDDTRHRRICTVTCHFEVI